MQAVDFIFIATIIIILGRVVGRRGRRISDEKHFNTNDVWFKYVGGPKS